MTEKIDLRVENIEFRWSETNKSFELIQWMQNSDTTLPDYCFVIAFFDKTKDRYDMRTVGARYVNALIQDTEAVKIVTQYAFEIIEARFRAEAAIKENSR
jgi:hypothetical protein